MKKHILFASVLLAVAGLLAWTVSRRLAEKASGSPARPEVSVSVTGRDRKPEPDRFDRALLLPEVWAIASNRSETALGERLRLVNSLPDDLSEIDRQALGRYMREYHEDQLEHVIVNNLMNRLRNQRELPSELTGLLLDLYRDRDQHIVIRTYAVQHLRPQYQLTREPEIRNAFYEALEETDTEAGGAALLALRFLTAEYPMEFDSAFLNGKAVEMAGDENALILNRSSALQVATMLRSPQAFDLVQQLSRQEDCPLILRLSAVAGLGEFGGGADLPFLEELAGSGGPYAAAARRSIGRILRHW